MTIFENQTDVLLRWFTSWLPFGCLRGFYELKVGRNYGLYMQNPKKETIKKIIVGLSFLVIAIISSCFHREFRGRVNRSTDKKTYLIIVEKNNPDCVLYVDGHTWPYQIGEKGLIDPGTHIIQCGSSVEIEIKKGTTFKFDYWGP